MSRKKKHEHVNHERWLVSYADFITLLFAFFVVLFASGQADKKKQQKFAAAMQQAFSHMALFEPHSRQPAINDGAGMNPERTDGAAAVQLNSGGPDLLEARIIKMIQDATSGQGHLAKGELTERKVPDGVALSLHEGAFFASGSAELRPDAVNAMETIAADIPQTSIRVEGHTDNVPIHSSMYMSNWELSSARASTIGRFLLEHSTVNPTTLSVAGYAEFHPIQSNATEDGRAANRRVDIVFLQPPAPATPTSNTSTQQAAKP